MRVLAVVPAFNEEECLEGTIASLKAACPDIDYLVVNDKVSDAAEEISAILVAESCRTKNRLHLTREN